jgi:hypothetical protein
VTDDGKKVFATLNDIEPEDRLVFESFLDDVDSVSPIDLATGEGPFPSFQLIQLEEFDAGDVLTKFDPGTSFDFDITIQSNRFVFSVLGSSMITYRDVLIEVNNAITGGNVTYKSMTPNTSHVAVVTSNTEAAGSTDDGNGGQTISTTSTVKVDKFLNTSVSLYDQRTGQGNSIGNATVDAPLYVYEGDHVLTGFDLNTTYTTKIDIGTTPYIISGTGAELTTYDQLIDLINNTLRTPDGNGGFIQEGFATYHTTFPRANQISIVGGIDTSTVDIADFANEPNPTAAFEAKKAELVAANFNKTVVISNFDMFTSTPIIHSLKVPVHGGRDLTDVIKYSYRVDKLVWREVIPFEWTEYYWGVAPGT